MPAKKTQMEMWEEKEGRLVVVRAELDRQRVAFASDWRERHGSDPYAAWCGMLEHALSGVLAGVDMSHSYLVKALKASVRKKPGRKPRAGA